MVDILQMTTWNAFYLIKKNVFWLKFHWSLIPEVQLTNKATLVQVMAWRKTGDKPLPEQIMTQFTNANMRR